LTDNSSANIVDCNIASLYNYGIIASSHSFAYLTGVRILNGACALKTDDGGHVEGIGNIFSGGTFSTIFVSAGSLSLQGNHILNNGGQSVFLEYFWNPPNVHLDLTGNYWGTEDAGVIAEWITDFNDDPSIHAIVDFEPFSDQPQPTDLKSWGEVKNLYR